MWIMRKSNEGLFVGLLSLLSWFLLGVGRIDLVPGTRYKVPGQKVDRKLD